MGYNIRRLIVSKISWGELNINSFETAPTYIDIVVRVAAVQYSMGSFSVQTGKRVPRIQGSVGCPCRGGTTMQERFGESSGSFCSSHGESSQEDGWT